MTANGARTTDKEGENATMKQDARTATAASLATIALVSMLTACGSNPDKTDGPEITEIVVSSKPPTPVAATPQPTGPLMHTLDDEARWKGGLSVKLGEIERGRTDDIGVPEDTDYVRVAVTLKNTSKTPLDLDGMAVRCMTQEVYDVEARLEGTPRVHVLPGKSHTWDIACAQKKSKDYFQIELSPQRDGDRTAIFSGTVE